MESVTKRIHISGLTPNISYSDLERRFASFGKVKALDGFGALDGNGQQRRFAYLTLEGSKTQVTKCLNVLSGTTWKGAKLRVGEAQPDFKERILKENELMKREASMDESERPKKRKRLARGCQGVHSSDMSLVTPENYSNRSGWTKTPLGRLVRPMRMRPEHPLPPPGAAATSNVVTEKKKKKKTLVLTRARRKLIDPLQWENEYLKGVLLEGGSSMVLPTVQRQQSRTEETPNDASPTNAVPQQDPVFDVVEEPSASVSLSTAETIDSPSDALDTSSMQKSDLAQEAAKDLVLLRSLFDGADGDEWGDRESLSDLDIDELNSRVGPAADSGGNVFNDFEVVPREDVKSARTENRQLAHGEKQRDAMVEDPRVVDAKLIEPTETTTEKSASAVQAIKLKDMFAPQEEDVGFSILGNLDIDLELDDTLDIQAAPLRPSNPVSSHTITPDPRSISSSQGQPIPAFDPNRILFFPLPRSEEDDDRLRRVKGKGKQLDIYDAMRERGWLDGPGFCRTETSNEIRKKWEDCKVDLTRDWKRRHREALKSARRRGWVALD